VSCQSPQPRIIQVPSLLGSVAPSRNFGAVWCSGSSASASVLLLFIQVYCPYATLGYERPTPHLLTDINIHSDTQAEPRKLSSLTLYIDLWQGGKPAPGQNPPVISPPVVIFRRIGVRAEIRTQNPVLSNTRLA
jgi:hypothetical protein